MRCAWQAYLNILPSWMRQEVDNLGRDNLLELRLRINTPPQLITTNGSVWLQRNIGTEDLKFCVNVASRYSPWAARTTGDGYITAQGGHRLGLCGRSVNVNSGISDIHDLTSLCVRVSRDFEGIAKDAVIRGESVLIIGRPGSGKTTFLRDYVRQLSNMTHESVAVVDEREEVFPRANNQFCYSLGQQVDVISGCTKRAGIELMLRNMTPTTIAVDEITASTDCDALLQAGWCGVTLVATAHAGTKEDLFQRPVYQPLLEKKMFDNLIILHSDRSWHAERIQV